ncbi:hypothetical protein QBC34DRAFT_498703 [Podospora aff. communis PSN243]|uniref:Uncharacterized protein n=1 Tax=Podospora aff. communis PSN243 TaxID=3040156 RepID=A0AAV9G501_9PEZI|nr:hypothetical protein QBC34DRAFT_498703 [Podospora aff. communis PSN243]
MPRQSILPLQPALQVLAALLTLPGAFAQSEGQSESEPTPSATAAAVDTAGFWVGFVLIFIISVIETLAAIIWTRIRVTSDGIHPCELSIRACGRELLVSPISANDAQHIATNGLSSGFYSGHQSSVTQSGSDDYGYAVVSSHHESADGCSTCGGWERRRMQMYRGVTECAIDQFLGIALVPTLLIRRFSPTTGVLAPAGLVENVKQLVLGFGAQKGAGWGRMLEHGVHLFVGLADLSLGLAGLALNPEAPQRLYDTIKDPAAPMTFESYLTLFLLSWLLGAALLICMIPLRSQRRSIQMFGWPGKLGMGVAMLANAALFGLGCWKIDVARREGTQWTPMLSYWIGGASAINFAPLGFELFHTFGVAGLVIMMIHTFS